ncbi:MAG: SURF1 family protein [Burkholderiaceae bacterium]|nr:SURF1 family protein [Burkholderiaceae bacterium]
MTSLQRAAGLRFWIITGVALSGLVVTASLGRWQLQRADQKEALQATMAERAALPPWDGAQWLRQLQADPVDLSSLSYRQVVLRGQWVPDATLFLDNRQMNGRTGFFVLTPLRLEGNAAVVMVQRGWVPRHFQDRTRLPPVATPTEPVQVRGRIGLPPSKLYEFTSTVSATGSQRIRQNLDLAAYRAETGLPLLDLSVVQSDDPGDGLLRDWFVPATGVDKHYGYAFQWFGLSGLIAILYVWFQIVRRFLRPRGQPSAEGGG